MCIPIPITVSKVETGEGDVLISLSLPAFEPGAMDVPSIYKILYLEMECEWKLKEIKAQLVGKIEGEWILYIYTYMNIQIGVYTQPHMW